MYSGMYSTFLYIVFYFLVNIVNFCFLVEDECAGVKCDEPDCDRSQWYVPEGECCDQCRKGKIDSE
jgi:hypothetical protein